jgi:hypothetical protein
LKDPKMNVVFSFLPSLPHGMQSIFLLGQQKGKRKKCSAPSVSRTSSASRWLTNRSSRKDLASLGYEEMQTISAPGSNKTTEYPVRKACRKIKLWPKQINIR